MACVAGCGWRRAWRGRLGSELVWLLELELTSLLVSELAPCWRGVPLASEYRRRGSYSRGRVTADRRSLSSSPSAVEMVALIGLLRWTLKISSGPTGRITVDDHCNGPRGRSDGKLNVPVLSW